MTQMISTPANYEALAVEVEAAMSAVLETISTLHAQTKALATTAEDFWNFEDRDEGWEASRADWCFADALHDVLEDVRQMAVRGIDRTARGLQTRAESYEVIERRKLRSAFMETVAAAAPLPSGFTLISAFTTEENSGRAKRYKANVAYMVAGAAFVCTERFDPTTGALSLPYDGLWACPPIVNKSDNDKQVFMFEDMGMSVEQIGVALDIRANILDALRAEAARFAASYKPSKRR
jgi:hypothetical protein